MPSRTRASDPTAKADPRAPVDRLRVLVGDKDGDQRALLCRHLEEYGHVVLPVDTGEGVLFTLETLDADLVLLGVDLPGLPAAEVCRAIRAGSRRTQPVVFLLLNGWTHEIDWIAQNELRVDDYLVRPFGPTELKLRIHARLGSRQQGDPPGGGSEPGPPTPARLSGRFTCGPLEIDLDRYFVHVNGQEVSLTATEMGVLLYFCQSPGFLRSRSDLLTTVWGYQPGVTSRTVDVCIKRLRQKLGAAGPLIETVRGLGYRFGGRQAVSHS
jgi:two-component system, OmpR family, phosphate regulon response regulator PhoB